MQHRTAVRVAVSLFAIDALVTAGGLFLVGLNRQTELGPGPSSVVSDGVQLLAFVPFAVVGALIVSRQPRNPIGGIFMVTALGMAVSTTAFEYAIYAILTDPGSLPGGAWGIRVSEWGFGLPFLAYVFLFLLFPSGRLPSRRWLPAASVTVLAVVSLEASEFAPGVVPFDLARALTVGALCAAATAPIFRFRRAASGERRQIRWFTVAAVPAVAALIAPLFVNPSGLYLPILFLATVGVAVATGVAIFRYRLFDAGMTVLRDLGFHARPPSGWNARWVLMWGVTAPTLLLLAFVFPVTWGFWWLWMVVALVLFGFPEWIGVWKTHDDLPPLTYTIRHFLPNWLAFPLIYGLLGAIGARWLGFGYPRFWGVGAMFALLGWLTDHFTITYARPDPHPHRLGAGEEGPRAGSEPETQSPPVIRQPRPF
jgi:hypothetical protein